MKSKIILGVVAFLAALSLLYSAGSSVNGSRTIQSTVNFCADAGSTDAYACNMSPALGSYVTGACYTFKANTANTGAASIAFNSLAAITIVKVAGGITTTLANNDIRVGQYVSICYDGTNMQMQSTLGNAPAASCTSLCVIGTASFSASGGSISNKVVSGVVSNVTRASAGVFDLTFTTNQSNYTVSVLANSGTTVATGYYMNTSDTSPPAAGFQIATINLASLTAYDSSLVFITIFK